MIRNGWLVAIATLLALVAALYAFLGVAMSGSFLQPQGVLIWGAIWLVATATAVALPATYLMKRRQG